MDIQDSSNPRMNLPDDPDSGDFSVHELPPPQSFVLKIWLEPDSRHAKPDWRGRITHISSGQYIQVHSFLQIVDFIAQHLKKMGADLPLVWRFYHWLGHFWQAKNKHWDRLL